MKNSCENILCAYYENHTCLLTKIRLDAVGMCTEGIRVDIEESLLLDKRKKLLEKIEQLDKNNL